MSGSWKKQTLAVAFAAMLAGSLAACGGGGGGSSTTGGTTGGTSNTTTDTVTTTSGGTATSATVVNTSATGVTGTGTTGTTSTGLTMADKISVISSTSAKTTAAPKGIKLAPKGKTTAPTGTTWAATADYVTDPTFTYIADRSEEAFKSSNEILCMIAQIKADKMVNKGAYLALVDKNKCSSNRDNAKSQGESSQNQSSGASAPDYEKWTVISNRADGATDPMVVSVWVPTTMGDPSKGGGAMAVIQAKAIVAEEPSAANPYGFFYMSFAGYADANGDGVADNTTVLMSGYMRTVKLSSGEVVLQFYDSRTENIAGTDYTFADYSTVFKNGTDVGGGEVKFPNWDAIWGTGGMPDLSGGVPYKQMRMAYDASTFKRQEVDATTGNVTGTAVCLDKTKFDTSAWRYGAYKAADGSRIALSSGFPLVYSDTNGDHQGWIGFYGMWFPDVTVPNGATVTKFDYSNGSATGASYTVFKSGGKLMKHTKESLTLADIKNVPVQYGMTAATGSGSSSKWYGTAPIW